MNDEYYMNIALKEAMKAYKKKEVPVGAIVVLNNKIIGKGYNTRQRSCDITNHAEIIALRNASRKIHDWRLNNAILYVTMSPCNMCASAIKESRIKKIVIGCINQDIKNKQIVDLIFETKKENSSIKITTGVLEQECGQLLQKFFKEQRNKVQL